MTACACNQWIFTTCFTFCHSSGNNSPNHIENTTQIQFIKLKSSVKCLQVMDVWVHFLGNKYQQLSVIMAKYLNHSLSEFQETKNDCSCKSHNMPGLKPTKIQQSVILYMCICVFFYVHLDRQMMTLHAMLFLQGIKNSFFRVSFIKIMLFKEKV